MLNFGLFGPWSSSQIFLFCSSFFNLFLFRFNFIDYLLWSKIDILQWFGGNWSINGWDSAIFIRILAVFGAWSSCQKVLLDLFSSIYFHFFSDFTKWFLWKKKENSVVVWRKSIHKRPRFSHFHAEFRLFWSVIIMTKNDFRPSFFNFFLFYFIYGSHEPKRHYVVFWRKLVHKRLRFSHFHAKFLLFLECGHHDKKCYWHGGGWPPTQRGHHGPHGSKKWGQETMNS